MTDDRPVGDGKDGLRARVELIVDEDRVEFDQLSYDGEDGEDGEAEGPFMSDSFFACGHPEQWDREVAAIGTTVRFIEAPAFPFPPPDSGEIQVLVDFALRQSNDGEPLGEVLATLAVFAWRAGAIETMVRAAEEDESHG